MMSADWRRIPLRQCQECPKLIPAAQDRCKRHERKDIMTTQAELWALQKKAHQSTEIANELRARAAREDERAAEYRKQLGQDAGTEVEEFAAALNDSAAPYYYPFDWSEATGIAASLIASGYRKPRTVTTAEERGQLTPGTIAVDDQGNAWKRGTGSWVSTGGDTPALYDDMDYAMTVLLDGPTE